MQMIGEDKKLSGIILKKLVDERRRKLQLQDELNDLGKEIQAIFAALESHAIISNITEVNSYLQRQRDFLHQKVIGGLLSSIENSLLKKKSF